MANDRLYLVCSVCKARNVSSADYARYLAKWFPSGGYYTAYGDGSALNPEDYVSRLDAFLDAHQECSLLTHGKNWAVGYEDDVPWVARQGVGR